MRFSTIFTVWLAAACMKTTSEKTVGEPIANAKPAANNVVTAAPRDAPEASNETPAANLPSWSKEEELAWKAPASGKPLKPISCPAKPTLVSNDPSAASFYGKLFAQGACFRFRLTYRAQQWEDDSVRSGPKAKDEVQSGAIECRVARAERIAAAAVSQVRCKARVGFDVTGNPPIRGPDLAPDRIYIATPAGLWWSDTWPRTAKDITQITDEFSRKLFTATAPGLHDKDVGEEDDPTLTTIAATEEYGRWCWQQTERDDYVVIEKLCFANGGLVEARRIHVNTDDVDTYVYDLIE